MNGDSKNGKLRPLVLVLVALGWPLVMADAAGPSVSRDSKDHEGDITIELADDYEACLPGISVSAPVREIQILDENRAIIADARCIDERDCLSSVTFRRDSTDGGPDCVLDGVFETDGDASSLDTSSELVVDGGGAGPGVECLVSASYADGGELKDCEGDYQVVATTAGGAVSTLSYSQTYDDGGGNYFGCGVAGEGAGRSPGLLDLLTAIP
jgi:hypothetical protein